LEIYGQAAPVGGASTTFVTLVTTGLTVAGGVVVGWLALVRDRRQRQQQDTEHQAQQSENLSVGETLGKLTQAVEDLNRRVERLEDKLDKPRSRRVRYNDEASNQD
jgi:type VI protein secretion system component VasK